MTIPIRIPDGGDPYYALAETGVAVYRGKATADRARRTDRLDATTAGAGE